LHHMMYKTLREQFPQLGSQMVCNAIYSVSRTSRLVFQSEQSPYNIQLLGDKPLPLLQFLPSAPVYFDRHTLSLKSGSLSMFTLDGRMRFEINLSTEDLARFKTMKLNEIILKSVVDQFALSFSFEGDKTQLKPSNSEFIDSQLPEYIVIDQTLAQHVTAEESTSVDPLVSVGRVPNQEQKVIHLQLGALPHKAIAQLTQAVPAVVQISQTQIQIFQKQAHPVAQASDMIQIKPPGDKL